MIISDTQMMNRMHENDNLQLNGPPVEPVCGGPFDAGHFFPEEILEQTDPSIAIIAVQRRR